MTKKNKMKERRDLILASDSRIRKCIAQLAEHERGREVLIELKSLLHPCKYAAGLDKHDMACLMTLIKEFVNGRRDFIHAFEVFRKGRSDKHFKVVERRVFASKPGEACDIVRACDAEQGLYLEVENYQAIYV